MQATAVRSDNDVLVTGVGLLSCLGEGVDAHVARLSGPDSATPVVDNDRFAPFAVHPLPEIDWSRQIERRGDQRQMETWQRIGTYVAGLALEHAGLKGNEAACGAMDLVVAAGGGERDQAVDEMILGSDVSRDARGVLLNEKLSTELRPTLFLAQLSNLLAGNISIVHKVTGSSRTLMGEEGAGVSALATAVARLKSDQSTQALVGAAYNAEHPDMLLSFELGRHLHHGAWKPFRQRGADAGGGVIAGSGGAFLVLETRANASARGARALAEVTAVAGGQATRGRARADTLAGLLTRVGAGDAQIAFGCSSGAHGATAVESDALSRVAPDAAQRFHANLTGTMRDAQFVFGCALAAAFLGANASPAPFVTGEKAASGEADAIAVAVAGTLRGEGAALLRRC